MLQPTQSFSYFPGFFVNLANAAGASFISRDIPCCKDKGVSHTMSRADFVELLLEALSSGAHTTMPLSWDLDAEVQTVKANATDADNEPTK